MATPPRSHLDLFSGIGGFALAAGWAGFTTSMFCEIDPFCRQVLKKHWPETPIHDDIRTLTADVVGQPIDLLTGGFPCQPFSVAGKQLGAADDRHLWPEMARVIDECRPRWILGENTPGIIGMELDNCLADLESLGYEAWPVVIPACGVGAWHQRQRVWIVAHSERSGQREQLRADSVQGSLPPTVRAQGPSGTRSGGSDAPDANGQRLEEQRFAVTTGSQLSSAQLTGETLSNTADVRRAALIGQQSDGTLRCDADELDAANTSRKLRDGTGRTRDGWSESSDSNWWDVESRVRGVPDGISTGVDRRIARLKSLGNAIVPQVAYEILKLMAA